MQVGARRCVAALRRLVRDAQFRLLTYPPGLRNVGEYSEDPAQLAAAAQIVRSQALDANADFTVVQVCNVFCYATCVI